MDNISYTYFQVLKQTIMTTVYGVTFFGARLQIQGQLEDLNFPSQHVSSAAIYLAKKTFFCLEKMFTSTKVIQVRKFHVFTN